MATKTVPKGDVRLMDLPGVEGGTLRAITVSSRTNAMEMLRLGAAAITRADDTGALVVYRDDEDMFRCEFMRHRRTVNLGRYKYLAAVDEWLRQWWPEMCNPAHRN